MMQHRAYTLSFVTPAFLGDAEQKAMWRTPPFKALLRQWWRILKAKDFGYDHEKLREAEGLLFGNAWLEDLKTGSHQSKKNHFCKSKVLVRLEPLKGEKPWERGKIESKIGPEWGSFDGVTIAKTHRGFVQVSSDLYLGFGAVLPPSKKENRLEKSLKGGAIGTLEKAILRLVFPQENEQEMIKVIQLIAWFGTLGSRSRNGWGSLHIQGDGIAQDLPSAAAIHDTLLGWSQCLSRDWAHAFAKDDKGLLIWLGAEPQKDWRKTIGILAKLKIKLRQKAKQNTSGDEIGGIHLLGYPAGKTWEIKSLGSNARLASQLRFKVLEKAGKFYPMVFHIPCAFPETLKNKLNNKQKSWLKNNEAKVWQELHRLLDGEAYLRRIR